MPSILLENGRVIDPAHGMDRVTNLLVDAFGEGATFRALLPALMFGGVGVGALAYTRAALPGWALERATQMEGLPERIPLLLKE